MSNVELINRLKRILPGLQNSSSAAEDAMIRALPEVIDALEELLTWHAVFPDIAPANVLPDRSQMEGALLALAEENVRMRGALEEISGRHVPDQPAAYDVPETDYIRKHYMELRLIARNALKSGDA
jgi:hypothetical protein